MPAHVLSVSARIDAPPERLYSIVADYRRGHPAILPRPPFVSLDVEEGGVGAGTVIRVGLRALGRLRTFRATVREPEPGRRLVEETDTGFVTTFSVDPVPGGGAHVAISTSSTRQGGLLRAVERRLAARMLRPIYVRELELLARVAAEEGPAAGPGSGDAAPGAP